MNKQTNTDRIEVLENRIAPAGLVTATYVPSTGELTITGDAANNSIEIFQTGPKTYRVLGLDGTQVNIAGNSFFDIGQPTKLTLDGDAGIDDFSLQNLRTLTSIDFIGGGGDSLTGTNITVKGNVEVSGGAGDTGVTFRGVSTNISGNVVADLAESVQMGFAAQNTIIGGSVFVSAGTGMADLAAFGDGPVRIGKGIEFVAGQLGGDLTLANVSQLTIGKLGSGESILFTSGAGLNELALSALNTKLAGGIRMGGGTGHNSLSISEAASTVKIGKLATGASVVLTGGAAADEIRIAVANLTLSGGIDFSGGAGDGSVGVEALSGTARIGKLSSGESIRYSGGATGDTLALESSSLALKGGIRFTGDAGNNTLSLLAPSGTFSIGKLGGGESILFTGAGGEDRIETDAALLTLRGGIDFSAGDGLNLLSLSSNNGKVQMGKLGDGRSIAFTGGAGADRIISNVANVTLAGGIELNSGGGNNEVEFDHDGLVRIGKFGTGTSLLFTGSGDADNEVDFGGIVTLAGSIEVTGGTGSDDVDLDGLVSVGKNNAGLSILLVGGDGNDEIDFTDTVNLAGGLRLDGGNGSNRLDLNSLESLTIRGDVQMLGGTGTDRFDLVVFALTITGSIDFTGGEGTDTFSVVADGSIGGNVTVNTGISTAGNQQITLQSRTSLPGGLVLKGGLSVDATGATGADAFTLRNVNIAKLVDVTLGDAASTVTIDNLVAGDEFRLLTGGGADVVNIERENLFGNSIIRKLATIQLGAGDDLLAIGSPLPLPNDGSGDSTRVNFIGGLVADGGDGAADNRNDFAAENTFGVPITSPTGFEQMTIV